MRIISEIVSLINKTLPFHLYAADFTQEMYRSLLKKLSISDKEEFFEDKKGAITKALIEYFRQLHQNIDLEITSKDFILKKHLFDPTRSELFDRMIHKNMVVLVDTRIRKEEYLVLPFLVSIPELIYQDIMQSFTKFGENSDTARFITRQQVNTVFELDERDIVFFIRKKITIRYFVPPKKLSSGIDKRFAGESIEEMELMYAHYFPNGMWEEIKSVLREILKEKLDFSSIDNITFTKTFIPVFRGMIEILLLDIMSPKEREKIEGLSGFVLRKYFDKILLFTAKNLLSFVEERDKNAEIFIKTFSDDVVIDANGNKIQKYAIVDNKQQKWKYISILSILMQYKQAKLRLIAQKEVVTAAREQVSQSEEELKGEKNNKTVQVNKIDEIKNLLANSDMISFKNRQANDPVIIASHAKQHEDLLTRKKIETNLLDVINNRIANKVIELTRRRKKLAYEMKGEQSLIEQMAPLKETYEGIAHGLAVVLTKR